MTLLAFVVACDASAPTATPAAAGGPIPDLMSADALTQFWTEHTLACDVREQRAECRNEDAAQGLVVVTFTWSDGGVSAVTATIDVSDVAAPERAETIQGFLAVTVPEMFTSPDVRRAVQNAVRSGLTSGSTTTGVDRVVVDVMRQAERAAVELTAGE
ncbi:MAG TPA: hypothetical protein VHR55_13175 [Candidatus Limnocylindria bacterium]|nr:hypothetical protein [Candidatus Limnocylindria bacterium]